MNETVSKEDYEALLANYNKLLERHKVLQRFVFASQSEKLKLLEKIKNQVDLWDVNPENAPASAPPEKENISYSRKKRSPDQNRTSLPDHLERKIEHIELPKEERICPECNEELVEIGEEVSEELEYIPAKLYVREIHRKKYACAKDTLHGVYRARLPKRIIPKGIPGSKLLAHILISKYVDHQPLDRQEDIFKRLGVRIPKSSMSDWLGKTCSALDPLLECLKNKMLDSRIINGDETRFKVQQNSVKAKPILGQMWAFVGDRKWVWYEWHPGRGSDVPMEVLKLCTGDYLQTDGYASYNEIIQRQGMTHLQCWAHARRKFVQALECGYNEAEGILKQIALLYQIEKEAQDLESPSQVKLLRQEQSIPILNQLLETLQKISSTELPKGKYGEAIAYALRRWNGLIEYCNDGELQIDNNIVERAMRPVALGRKNYLFSGSTEGARWASSFYSLIETCKLQGIDPAEYLSAVLSYIGDYEGESMETLLPDAYKLKIS